MQIIQVSSDKIKGGEFVFSSQGELSVGVLRGRVLINWDSTSGRGPFSLDPARARQLAHAIIWAASEAGSVQDSTGEKEIEDKLAQ